MPGLAAAFVAAALLSLPAAAQTVVTYNVGDTETNPVVLNDGDSLDNAGTIDIGSTANTAVYSLGGNSTVPSIINRSTGSILGDFEIVVVNGTLNSFDNSGVITSRGTSLTPASSAVVVNGTIGNFVNSGAITSGNDHAVWLIYNASVGTEVLGNFVNTATGTLQGGDSGVFASFDVGTFANHGDIHGVVNGVWISGGATRFENTGDITSDSLSGNDYAVHIQNSATEFFNSGDIRSNGSGVIYDNGIAQTFVNSGTIEAMSSAVGFSQLVSFTNTGTISSTYSSGVYGTIGTFLNTGGISAVDYAAVWLSGTVTRFENRGGTISSDDWYAIESTGPVTELLNSGTIHSGFRDAIYLYDHATTIINSGVISGDTGISAYTVGTLTNAVGASITGNGLGCGCGYGIFAESIDSLTNAGVISGLYQGIETNTDLGFLDNRAGGRIESTQDAAVEVGGTLGTLINAGTISGIYGIYADVITTLTNAGGTILGEDFGVLATTSLDTLINSGTIESSDGIAVQLGEGKVVRNSGRIVGAQGGMNLGALPYIPFANPGTTSDIINFAGGVIEATDPSCGCFPTTALSFVNGTLENLGTIRGGIGVAIVGDGTTGVVVTNSGTIEGTDKYLNFGPLNWSMAMLFDSEDYANPDAVGGTLMRDDTLKLLPGSKILGAVDFDAGDHDTLDLRNYQGNQLFVGFNLEHVLTGSSITVVDNTVPEMTLVLTVDDTPLKSAASVQFNTFSSTLLGAIRGAFGTSFSAASGPSTLGYLPSVTDTPAGQAALDLATGGESAEGTRVWAASFGDLGADSTAGGAFRQLLGGIVFGAHTALDANTKLGGIVSVASSVYATDIASQTIRSTLGAVGGYGETDFGFATLDFALLGGASANHSERYISGVFGNETAVADYTSWFVSPELGLGIPLFALETIDTEADIRVRFVGGQAGGYTETGATLNLTVPTQTIALLEARGGLTATAEFDEATLTTTIGALVLSNLGGSTTNFSIAGTSTSFPLVSTTPGTTTAGLYAGTSLDIPVSASASLDAGAGLEIRADGYRSLGGSVSLAGTF